MYGERAIIFTSRVWGGGWYIGKRVRMLRRCRGGKKYLRKQGIIAGGKENYLIKSQKGGKKRQGEKDGEQK